MIRREFLFLGGSVFEEELRPQRTLCHFFVLKMVDVTVIRNHNTYRQGWQRTMLIEFRVFYLEGILKIYQIKMA